jgi:D-alanyl-lipoteichoic acid acyltransferase DltB (MBOAT superfamily)
MNLVLTMLLCGLWHGANWNFVFWGGIHGVSLAVHRAWVSLGVLKSSKNRPGYQFVGNLLSRVLTLCVVLLGWLFFRAQSWADAGQYLSRLMAWTQDGTRVTSPYILSALGVVFVTHLVFDKDHNWALEISERSVPVRIVNYTALALLIACLGATDSAPFIYFRF